MTKVLIVAAECMPFAKTGGLADVVGSLAPQLCALGLDARVILPLHRTIKEKWLDKMTHICNFYVHLGWRSQYVGLKLLELDGVKYYFIDNEYYFGGPIYKGGTLEGEQYAFFCRAVLSVTEFTGFEPDILHLNDWHTAMIAALLRIQYSGTPLSHAKTVFTIHNLAYQGRFAIDTVKDWLGIEDRYFSDQYIEYYGSANFLKAGLVFADKVTTVSPNYAREIRDPYFSEGMDGVLSARGDEVIGILNGIDTAEFDPASDTHISANYSADDLSGKAACKQALIDEMRLSCGTDVPIIGMVSRLTSQKGLDLLRCVFGDLMHDDIALVVLGSGDPEFEGFLMDAANRYPGKVAVRLEYNNDLAHRIYAGADLFLMPSLFEPCGLCQMISMRYGTIPIVRETGGLFDTVRPYNRFINEGNGFTFANYNAHDMLSVIRMATTIYMEAQTFSGLIRRAMEEDFSFIKAARKYAELFDALAEDK